MIDRDARNNLAAVIRRYLDEEIKAFELDDLLWSFHNSNDSAVRFVANTMWFHYDDCKDHYVVASKPEWDYFQRLLLLLESDSTVVRNRYRHWSATQLVAALFLAACLWLTIEFGVGIHLMIFFIPCGVASIILSRLRRRADVLDPFKAIVIPFSSIADLQVAYESARSFRKRQFPRHLEPRLIRSPFMDALLSVPTYAMWIFLAPLPLLAQCFPISINCPIVKPE